MSSDFVKSTLKLIEGTTAKEASAVLVTLTDQAAEVKSAIVKISVIAAVGARVNINSFAPEVVKDIPANIRALLSIGNSWNFTLLAIIGNIALEQSTATEVLAKAYTRRIGGKSIFSTDLSNTSVSNTRLKILKENKAKWGMPSDCTAFFNDVKI